MRLSDPAIFEIGQAIYATLEVDELVPTILTKAVDYIGVEAGSVWLLADSGDCLSCRYAVGPRSEPLVGMTLHLGEGIAGWVTETQTPVVLDDVRSDPRWASRFDKLLGITTRNLASVPLVARGQTLGALELINKLNLAPFDEEDGEKLLALAGLAALAIHNAQLFERERRLREQQALLHSIGPLLHESLDLDRLLQQILTQVSVHLKAEATSVWLRDEERGSVVCHVATGVVADQVVRLSVPLGKGIVGLVAATGETVMVPDARADPRVSHEVDAATGFVSRSMLTVPLLRKGQCLGAIQVINKESPSGLFTPFDQEVLEQLANSAAFAIENARLYNDLELSYEETLDALIGALDLRDRETQGHSRRVMEYTLLLAKQMGVNASDLVHIQRGALLHDIGKIGVPDRILHKPGPMNAEERVVLERHPWLGYEMMVGIPFLAHASEIVLSHHERFDGRGYPRGLSGDSIPLGARLFAVVDAFDAITSDRPYRPSRPYEVAVAEIGREAGKQFDPKVVEVFLSIPPERWRAIQERVNAETTDQREASKALARTKLDPRP